MRRRLEPQQRREALLDTGAAMSAEKPYDHVVMRTSPRVRVCPERRYITIFRISEIYT
jgi:hypothetical protein